MKTTIDFDGLNKDQLVDCLETEGLRACIKFNRVKLKYELWTKFGEERWNSMPMLIAVLRLHPPQILGLGDILDSEGLPFPVRTVAVIVSNTSWNKNQYI